MAPFTGRLSAGTGFGVCRSKCSLCGAEKRGKTKSHTAAFWRTGGGCGRQRAAYKNCVDQLCCKKVLRFAACRAGKQKAKAFPRFMWARLTPKSWCCGVGLYMHNHITDCENYHILGNVYTFFTRCKKQIKFLFLRSDKFHVLSNIQKAEVEFVLYIKILYKYKIKLNKYILFTQKI